MRIRPAASSLVGIWSHRPAAASPSKSERRASCRGTASSPKPPPHRSPDAARSISRSDPAAAAAKGRLEPRGVTNQRPTNAHLARIPRRFPSVHSVDDAVMLRSEFGESARLEDQLQLDDEANSEIADGIRWRVGTWQVAPV